MPLGNPQAYMQQGMSPQQAMQKAGGGGGMQSALGAQRPAPAGAGVPPMAGRPQLPPGGQVNRQQVMQLVQEYSAVKSKAARIGISMQDLDKLAGGAAGAPGAAGARPSPIRTQAPAGGGAPMGAGAPMGGGRMPMGGPGGVR